MITPWRSAPRAGTRLSMPKCVASVYRIASPPGSTARRSARSAGQRSLSVWPAWMQPAMHQRSPSGVMRPSVTPLAASSCDTAPTVPDEPSASCQRLGAKGCSASSSSAPAAICAARKAWSLSRPSPKKRIDRLTLPTWKDSASSGVRPWPRIISVERPPMSTTSRDASVGCRCDTPA